MGVQQHKGP